MSGAELTARITAAAAVLGDFRRADDDYLDQGCARPDYSSWAHRLASALGSVLDGQAPALTPHQREVMAQAIGDGITYRDPAGACLDCEAHPAGLCEDHAADLDRTDAYLTLARELDLEVDR
jgi:hypothetical protein